jgi:hypothetical protein
MLFLEMFVSNHRFVKSNGVTRSVASVLWAQEMYGVLAKSSNVNFTYSTVTDFAKFLG